MRTDLHSDATMVKRDLLPSMFAIFLID